MIANGHRELASVGNTSRCGGFLTQGSATRTTCGGTTKGSGTLQGGALLNHYFTIRIDLEISPFSSPSSFYQCRRRTLLHR
ncbi:hypothetical protein JHK82_055492 [Glycine max]|uniref:Uncharacterized protein n=2 Tax=Glycine subgen. Soja TaxID=1462606 RepID=A0A0R0EHZ5_SOYBN|nr:hypothetical protein JHK86_055324 [Glycine max]RZB42604.1 hypothetical protein D0Y65_053256 [Glycine soja]KAG4918050.1 hypothetical protein JHK85_056331 [Glycine max]KAG5074129.1 hypothetical protein JHK84_055360 [Glycine max]KAG5076797.1 hypothetical protein JHK82_055492 [Glycine max]